MAYEDELFKALKERMLRMTQDMPMSGAPPINIYNGMPYGVSETLNAGGSNTPGRQAQAAKQGVTPEELEYLVDISKRDVKQEVGVDSEGNPIIKTVGWDKKVHRYTEPKGTPQDHMAMWDEQDPSIGYADHGTDGGIGVAGTKPSMKKKKKQPNLWGEME